MKPSIPHLSRRKKRFSNYRSILILLLAGNYMFAFTTIQSTIRTFSFAYSRDDSSTEVAISKMKTKTKDGHNSKHKAMICAIVIDEEAYIDEWVDYHYALGFDKMHIYDNSKLFELKKWGEKKGDHVEVTHFPGETAQMRAYHDCAQKAVIEGIYTWAAFFDIDEFLVLKDHDDVHDMLEQHLQSGALGISWLIFHPTQIDFTYPPLPVTKRFVYREAQISKTIKSIAKLSDIDLQTPDDGKEFHAYYAHKMPFNKPNVTRHGTNGVIIPEFFHPKPTMDVAVLHHYRSKSHKEYVAKRERGRVDKNDKYTKKQATQARREFEATLSAPDPISTDFGKGFEFDDSAWQILKKNVPEYAVFDTLYSHAVLHYDPKEMVDSLVEGQAIKCLGKIHRYTKGQRRSYPNEKVYLSWEKSLDNIKSINDAVCEIIPEGPDMEVKKDSEKDPKEMVESLVEGQAIKCRDKIYKYTKGQRHMYPNEKVYLSWEKSLDNVKKVDDDACKMIPEGPIIPPISGCSDVIKPWNPDTYQTILQNNCTTPQKVQLVNNVIGEVLPDGQLVANLVHRLDHELWHYQTNICNLLQNMAVIDTIPVLNYPTLPKRPLLNMTWECLRVWEWMGQGNWVTSVYTTRITAAAARVDFQFQCSDRERARLISLLPWLETYQPAPTDDNPWPYKGEVPNNAQTCSRVFENHRVDYMIDEITNDMQRMGVAIMGTQGGMTHPDVPKDQPPLVPGIEAEDVVIHFRCGDIFGAVKRDDYGIIKFTEYKKWIDKDAKSVGIVTQPFTSEGNRRVDIGTTDQCKTAVMLMVDYLQDFLPEAIIKIHNEPSIDSLPLTYARLVMAKQSFTTLSSFGIFPVIGGFGEGHFQRGNRGVYPFAVHLPAYYPQKLHMMDAPFMSAAMVTETPLDQVLKWFVEGDEDFSMKK